MSGLLSTLLTGNVVPDLKCDLEICFCECDDSQGRLDAVPLSSLHFM
jgi:hypothetical protein